jgi:hypothetical protein
MRIEPMIKDGGEGEAVSAFITRLVCICAEARPTSSGFSADRGRRQSARRRSARSSFSGRAHIELARQGIEAA